MEDKMFFSSVVIFLLSIIGFFFRSLVKSLEETKEALNDIKNALTQYITKQDYIEKQVLVNEKHIYSIRERTHELGNIINGVKGRVDIMENKHENRV